jgi:hypothetical protein
VSLDTCPASERIPSYRLHNPALAFPWVPTTAGAPWLGALVHRGAWNRCGVEQLYFTSVDEMINVNGLTTDRFLTVEVPVRLHISQDSPDGTGPRSLTAEQELRQVGRSA